MIWLIVAILAVAGSMVALQRGWGKGAFFGRLVFYFALGVWMWAEAGPQAFRGSETGLLGWLIIGLALFALGDGLGYLTGGPSTWSFAAAALAALAFALGFDILRPDEYALVPGVLLALLVASVAVRAYLQMTGRKGGKGSNRVWLGMYMAAIAVMVFAGVFKMIDRGWALPWAYLAGGGALSYAAGQLWLGGERVLGKQTVPAWVQVGALNLGQVMMVVAALFVYREFL